MAIWYWKIKNEELFRMLKKEIEKNKYFDFERNKEYKLNDKEMKIFFQSFYKINDFYFLLDNENQEFLFYSVFYDFFEPKDNFIIRYDSLEYNFDILYERIEKIKNKGVDLIFENIGTHSNSSFYTSSKNTIYYKNKSENEYGFSSLKISKNPLYFSSTNATEIPLTKAFTAKLDCLNILDILISEDNKYKIFIDNFKKYFGIHFYNDLKKGYYKFIQGDYNKNELTGIEKQILIPDEDQENGYISISPMVNHNIGFFLNPLLYEKNKLLDAKMKSIGGTQPQNVSYVNSLLNGNLINFKMAFPYNQKSEIGSLLFNLNTKNLISINLGKELHNMNIVLNKSEIPNSKKEIIINNFINLFVEYFLELMLIFNNEKEKITNKKFLKLISLQMDYKEIRDYLKILVEDSIYPKKYKKELTKELRDNIVDRIVEQIGDFNE